MIDLFDIGLSRRVCLIEGFVDSPVTCISKKLPQEILTPLCRPSVSGPRARLCRSSAASCLCMTAVTSCCKSSVRTKWLLWLERQAQERPRRYSHTVCHHFHVTSFLSTFSSLQFNTAVYLLMKQELKHRSHMLLAQQHEALPFKEPGPIICKLSVYSMHHNFTRTPVTSMSACAIFADVKLPNPSC